jgi:hypothetical protein
MKMLHGYRSVLSPLGIILTTILSVIFCILGLSGIILSIVELARGRAKIYHYDESQGGLTVENPLWPSSGIIGSFLEKYFLILVIFKVKVFGWVLYL